jgi:hypothetical protein
VLPPQATPAVQEKAQALCNTMQVEIALRRSVLESKPRY